VLYCSLHLSLRIFKDIKNDRCSQLKSLNLVKFYYCKPKSTGRDSLIKKNRLINQKIGAIVLEASVNLAEIEKLFSRLTTADR
jgi:hypothetical protein